MSAIAEVTNKQHRHVLCWSARKKYRESYYLRHKYHADNYNDQAGTEMSTNVYHPSRNRFWCISGLKDDIWWLQL